MKFKNIIKIVSLVVLLFILYQLVDVNKIIYYVKQTNGKIYILSLFLLFPLYFFKSLRLYNILLSQGIKYSIFNVFIIYFSSNFLGFVTPGRIGEFAKIIYLKQEKNISISKSFPPIVLDRFYDLYFLVILGIIGCIYYNLLQRFHYLTYMIFCIILIFPYVFFNYRILKKILDKLQFLKKFIKVDKFFITYIKEIRNIISFRQILLGFLLTLIAYSFFFAHCKFILISLNIDISYINIILIMSITNIITFLPISISGIGSRELILMFLFSSILGMEKELAISYSVMFFIAFNLIGGVIGFIFWLIKPIKFKIN